MKHDHKIKQFMKYLKMKHKAFPAIEELIQEQMSYILRTAYRKIGINAKVCETCAALEDDSEWEVKIPSEVKEDANMKYSVSTSAGQYECSETGLRWRSDTDVSLEYRFVDWESLHEDIMKNYKPCGPLMDITVTSGSLEEIHLPHFICYSGSSSDDAVKALHVNGSEASLKRCELTRSHAKLLNPTFSLLGIIAHIQQYFTMEFHCETLIYRNRISALNLHVYLILNDEKLKKDVKEKEKKNMEIVKPTPNKALKINKFYTLKTSCDSKINPQDLKLTPSKANFFDLYIQDGKKPIELYIKTKDKTIWEVNIESEEFSIHSPVCHQPAETAQKRESCKNCKGAEFVEKHRAELIKKVSLVEPIADDMKDLIGDEKYQIIFNSVTPQDRMRKLLGFLTTTKLKEKLYKSLLKHERFLVEDLQHSQ
ncbi:NACHT, LRR and PYD domains-containing protein 1b allele 5-like [Carassius auratus]|uniref:NACHT, LRR and PYD domains-containing protein 1b allele 5-like n=1 Tax=Carassius auratus TaxID=7957 RepID=A0A6P6P5I3_CARAU|nr:NACHT, LRR and PYD domains-containing protein 1b allele 5-like [Carassius auratus]